MEKKVKENINKTILNPNEVFVFTLQRRFNKDEIITIRWVDSKVSDIAVLLADIL